MSTPTAATRGTARSAKFRPRMMRIISIIGFCILALAISIYYAGYRRGSGDDCSNKKSACTAEKGEKVLIPEGKLLCFDNSFWDNLPQLGFSMYKGNIESAYMCTEAQVIAGACNQRIGNAFRFNPKGNMRIPKYWFQKKGTVCAD